MKGMLSTLHLLWNTVMKLNTFCGNVGGLHFVLKQVERSLWCEAEVESSENSTIKIKVNFFVTTLTTVEKSSVHSVYTVSYTHL